MGQWRLDSCQINHMQCNEGREQPMLLLHPSLSTGAYCSPPSLLGFICAGELTQMRIFEKRYQVSMCLYICLYIYLYICLYICLGGGRSGSRTLSLLIH